MFKITLFDLYDWVIYENQYTENDIGYQIHKRVELTDIYNSFADGRAFRTFL